MDNINIEYLRKKKKDLHLTNEELAKLSGVPLSTVQKVMGNVTSSPRRETIIALAKVLVPRDQYELPGTGAGRISEGSPLPDFTKKQGEYTIDDYYAWPEDQRIELIDGYIYDMGAPIFRHQDVAGSVYIQLRAGIDKQGSDCLCGISPLDVQLDCDDKTMVQPDVIILCSQDKHVKGRVYGAPDFCLEVLSPSSRSRDQVIKLNKYLNAGVREYWIVDPVKERVTVYCFEKESWPDIYSFNERIPLYISGDKIEVDFSIIKSRLDRFFPSDDD